MNKFSTLATAAVAAGILVGLSALPIAPSLTLTKAFAQETTKKKRHPGKRLYMRSTCMACHGKGGIRSIQDYPNVAAQPEKYIYKQIKDILSGKRVGGIDSTGAMRTQPMVGALVTAEGEVRVTDEQIAQIANWLSLQPPAPPAVPDEDAEPVAPLSEAQLKEVKKLYKKNCRACHGKNALKPLKGYPIIAGQKKAYIIAQVNDVKNKIRTNGKIKSMYSKVKKLSDEQIDLLASYLSAIDRTK